MWFRLGVLAFQNRNKLPYLVVGFLFIIGFLMLLPALFLMMFMGGDSPSSGTGEIQTGGAIGQITPGKDIAPWISVIEEKASQYGVDPALVAAVMTQESGGNPRVVSSVGAIGLMQLMPETAKGLGVSNPFDPIQNIEGGTKYLADLLREFNGNLVFAVAAYNAGPGAVQMYKGVPPYQETQNYVRKVIGYFFEYREIFRRKQQEN